MSKAITFWSVDGGVGKTTLATNSAIALAKENPAKEVLLLDFNLFNPHIHKHLNVKVNSNFVSLFEKYLQKESILNEFNNYITKISKISNLKFLQGLMDINYFDKLDINYFKHLLTLIKKQAFDYIIIDVNGALNIDATFASIVMSDLLVTVLEPTFPSLSDTSRYIKEVLNILNISQKNIYPVVNKYDGGLEKQNFEITFNKKDIHYVPYFKGMRDSINIGNPIYLSGNKKHKKIKQNISKLAKKLI
ncbi:MAG: AAA family ATPase [Candidatus Woesearchaeota archaeon]